MEDYTKYEQSGKGSPKLTCFCALVHINTCYVMLTIPIYTQGQIQEFYKEEVLIATPTRWVWLLNLNMITLN